MQTELTTEPDPNNPILRNLNRVLRCYQKMACKPRSLKAWKYMMGELWTARADALAGGVLRRDSDAYQFVTARFNDARFRIDNARLLQSAGRADPRV